MYNDKKRIAKDKKLPKSIHSVVRMYPSNQVNRQFYGGLPHLGNALWGMWDSSDIERAAEAYDDYSLSTNLLIPGFKTPTLDKVRLGGGSPARFKPFEKSIEYIKETLTKRILSDYPLAAGDDSAKEPIVEYFNSQYPNKISKNNIIFTHSSTQGFTLVMEAILDYGDVVIMTAPNYGLFSFIPERVGGRVRLLELRATDDWKVDPRKLKKLIQNTNQKLRADYDRNRGKYIFRRSDMAPKVAAFIHINPHNPTGVVYGKRDKDLLLEISDICKKLGVFVVDDLAYSGLEYDRKNLAVPVYSLDESFDNTITLHTLSKAYGLAGIRSGMIIAHEVVISLIRDRIFQASDSLSLLQSSAMSATFLPGKKEANEREEYFKEITHSYYKHFIFVKALINGYQNLNKDEKMIIDKVLEESEIKIDIEKHMQGISDVEIIIEPESGFFVLLDLTNFLGRSYKGFKILDDRTLLQFLYTSGNIKTLTGKAFCWGTRNQLIIRVTTALEYDDLIDAFTRLKESLDALS